MVRRSHLASATQTLLPSLSAVLFFLGLVISGHCRSTGADISGRDVAPQSSPSAPLGASRYMFCHPSEVEGYARSAMAHSL